jgi:hypothetical protein
MAHSADDMMTNRSFTTVTALPPCACLSSSLLFSGSSMRGTIERLRGSMGAETAEVGADALDRYASRATVRSGEEHQNLTSKKHRRGCVMVIYA